MTAIVTLRLLCEGRPAGQPCGTELAAPADVHSIKHLRTVAYRDFGWMTRGRDLCPACRLREVGV